MSVRVKICGLCTPEAVDQACSAGASYAGFVFYPPSPRAVGMADAQALMLGVKPGVIKVALTVDADDALIERISALPVDMFQLHGHESPQRVAQIRARTGLPVMKAIGVAEAADLGQIGQYASAADQLLIDAKPGPDAILPGGNGRAFDWHVLAGRRWPLPWLLAGGLHADNVGDAIRQSGAAQLDVSTGVESGPGQKDPARIRAFMAAAKSSIAAKSCDQ